MKTVDVGMHRVPQFEDSDISSMSTSGKDSWYFSASMISTCLPLLDDCGDNYDVESLLRKAKVIRQNNDTDTESCALVVNFRTRESKSNFLRRLNVFLVRRAEKFSEGSGA